MDREQAKKMVKHMDIVKDLIELRKEFWEESNKSEELHDIKMWNARAQQISETIEMIFAIEWSKLGANVRDDK